MTHALIIRFHYEKDDKRYPWRLAYFKSMVLPRILNQTVKNFEIYMRVNPWQVEEVKALDPRINIFMVEHEKADYKYTGGKKYFLDFVPYKQVCGLPMFDIQSGLDSDDLIAPDYMETVQRVISEQGDERVHVCYQPEIFDLKDLKIRPIGTTYTPTKGSAFLSLYQPKKIREYKFIYEESHLKMGRGIKSIVLPAGKCWATVHGKNESTGV